MNRSHAIMYSWPPNRQRIVLSQWAIEVATIGSTHKHNLRWYHMGASPLHYMPQGLCHLEHAIGASALHYMPYRAMPIRASITRICSLNFLKGTSPISGVALHHQISTTMSADRPQGSKHKLNEHI